MRKQSQRLAKAKSKPRPFSSDQTIYRRTFSRISSRRDYRPMYVGLVMAAAIHYAVISALNVTSLGASIAIGLVLAYVCIWLCITLSK